MTMCVDDSRVHIVREAEIVSVNDEAFQPLKDVQLDAEKLLGIGAEVFQQAVQLARGSSGLIIERGIDEELTDRALSRIDLVDGGVDLLKRYRNLVRNLIALE